MNSHFTEQEETNAIKDLKYKKACGRDEIPSEALKAASSVLVPHLTVLYTPFIVDIGDYPASWVKAQLGFSLQFRIAHLEVVQLRQHMFHI